VGDQVDVAVVGGGPVGLAATLALASAGYRPTLIAPKAATGDLRTSALLAGSVSLLDRLGVWDKLAVDAAPLRTLRIVDGTQRLIRAPEVAFDAREIGLDAFGYNIPNSRLVAALESALGSRQVVRIEALADAIATESDRVEITTSDHRMVAAQLAIAADGSRSRLRDAAGIAVETWDYDQAALVSNLGHTQPHHDTSTEFHTENGPFTLVPLGRNRSSLVWVDRPDTTRRRLDASDGELADEIETRSASILGAITIEGQRQAFPLKGLTANSFAARRIMLAGEAAHLFPPIGAQGLNLGLRDVEALASVLAGPVADPGAPERLAAYDRARRPDVTARTMAVDALNRTLLTDFLPVQAMRGLGLFLVDRVPPLRRMAMRQGLGV
jgi:2-octaprenyl-6-methoxyphenol hydroxylase